MAERVPICGDFRVPHGGDLTQQQLDAAAHPVGEALAQVSSALEPRLRIVERLRTAMYRAQGALRDLETARGARPTPQALAQARRLATSTRAAFERTANALEAEVTTRLAQTSPGARETIERIQREAATDHAAVIGGADRDLDAWLGTGATRWFYETFRAACVVDNNNASVMLRGEEARHSATVYQRLRVAYERLHPRASETRPLPREPMNYDGD